MEKNLDTVRQVLAFSKTMLLDYKRIQFTPDVLPSDLT